MRRRAWYLKPVTLNNKAMIDPFFSAHPPSAVPSPLTLHLWSRAHHNDCSLWMQFMGLCFWRSDYNTKTFTLIFLSNWNWNSSEHHFTKALGDRKELWLSSKMKIMKIGGELSKWKCHHLLECTVRNKLCTQWCGGILEFWSSHSTPSLCTAWWKRSYSWWPQAREVQCNTFIIYRFLLTYAPQARPCLNSRVFDVGEQKCWFLSQLTSSDELWNHAHQGQWAQSTFKEIGWQLFWRIRGIHSCWCWSMRSATF